MAVETNARIEFSVASVEEWEKVNPKLHQGEPVFAKKPSGKYILKVGAPGGSTYENAVVVWDQDDAETKMTSTQEAAAQALASKNAASASASAAKASEDAAAASKSAAATSAENAKTSETNAAASKASAANSASTASSNATASADSASAAATSENNALNSANAAATSESNAKTSETNAAKSATAAAQSAKEAATFDPSYYLASKDSMGKTPESAPQIIFIPLEKGMFPINGYPDKLSSTTGKYTYSIVTNFQGKSGTLFSLYAQHTRRELYFRTGYADERGWGSWVKLATEENMAALDAKIPTKTSQLTNDSNFATKDQLPTKTSQLTNDSGFVNASSLEEEAKKWKAAYNNLRKRSTPTAFDDDELTLLISTMTNPDRGITLPQPYTDFDGLLIEYTGRNQTVMQREYTSTAEINKMVKAIHSHPTTEPQAFFMVDGWYYWTVKASTSHKFSATFFPNNDNTIFIWKLWGVKFKEIT